MNINQHIGNTNEAQRRSYQKLLDNCWMEIPKSDQRRVAAYEAWKADQRAYDAALLFSHQLRSR